MADKIACFRCQYFDEPSAESEFPEIGNCRRFPPVIQIDPKTNTVMNKDDSPSPVNRNHWCREFAAVTGSA